MIRKIKRGQGMELPFKMIFSIIMIAVIIFVGFFVINMFLDQTKQVELNTLPNEIREAVVQAWQSSETERTIELTEVSGGIEEICFVDFSESPRGTSYSYYTLFENFDDEANFFYYPLMKAEKYKSFTSWQIKCGNNDCLRVPTNNNPLCIKPINGRFTFTLIKESGQSYVTINP